MPISDCEYDPESGVVNSVRRNVPFGALVQAAEHHHISWNSYIRHVGINGIPLKLRLRTVGVPLSIWEKKSTVWSH